MPRAIPSIRKEPHLLPQAVHRKRSTPLRTVDGSYRVLSDVARLVTSETDLGRLLGEIADSLESQIPHDGLVFFEADLVLRRLHPLLVRHPHASEIYRYASFEFGHGITGFGAENREAVMSNEADMDPRWQPLPGAPSEPESMITVPMLAHDELKGMLNLYRLGRDNWFTEAELELSGRFAELAALAVDNAQLRGKLETHVVTDHLTGSYNHRYFQERLVEEVDRAGRTQRPAALVLVDVDNLARVNEEDSPLDGDQVLTGLGKLLRDEARPGDVICRVGGDEFGLILPGVASDHAVHVAERLRSRIADAEFNGSALKVTVSMGVAETPAQATEASKLVACANYALLQAKAEGKNRVSAYVAGEWEGVRGVPKEQSRLVGQLKLLQSFASRLNRLLEVGQIGEVLMQELKSLIDYDSFRVHLLDPNGVTLRPIAFHGHRAEYEGQTAEGLEVEMGEGITGRVAETGESIYAPDAMKCDMAVDIPGTPDVDESVLAVPLTFGSRVIGTMAVSKLGLARFDVDDLRVMEALASHVAVAIENARLFGEERQSAETANALLRVSQALTRRQDVTGVMEHLAGSAADLLACTRVSLWLRDRTGSFHCAAHVGYDGEDAQRIQRIVVPAEIADRHLLSTSQPFFMPEETGAGIAAQLGMTVEAGPMLVAPITWDPDGVAAILAAGAADWRITPRHLRLSQGLADMASLALGNAHRFAHMEKGFLETVEVLANALEAKDSYTHGHAHLVAEVAVSVGREMGVDEEDLRVLELAGVFHDIGKIGIGSEVLGKTGALNEVEWAEMRRHPAIGEQIMAPVEFLQPVRPLIRSHHERWDGGGYPDGLRGEEIPLGARIVALCDAWHAMTSDRPYRRALPEKEAIRRLREAAGTQFDPAVVEAFLGARSKGLIRHHHPV